MIPINDRVSTVQRYWRAALSRPPHPAGCQCMGLFLVPQMGAADLEADITEFFRERYAAEGLQETVAVIDARFAAQQAGRPPPFREWIGEIGSQPAAQRLLADLETMLAELAGVTEAGQPASRFVCL